MLPFPATINPFFNFMKNLRETTCFNKTVVEVAKEAGDRWRNMSECEKVPFIIEAYKVSRNKMNDAPKRRNSCCSMVGEPKAKKRKMNC